MALTDTWKTIQDDNELLRQYKELVAEAQLEYKGLKAGSALPETELSKFLANCSDKGLFVQRISRVDPELGQTLYSVFRPQDNEAPGGNGRPENWLGALGTPYLSAGA